MDNAEGNQNPEQPSQPVITTPLPGNQIVQPPIKNKRTWPYYLLLLGIFQALGVASIYVLVIIAMVVPGIGLLIGLTLPITLVPALGLAALINLIALPIYMVRYKPRRKALVFSIVSLVVSISILLYGVFLAYQSAVVIPAQDAALSEQGDYGYEQAVATGNGDSEITKEEATNLLETCQLSTFYYTNQTDKENSQWGELSTTGVVLKKIADKPYSMSVADKLVPDLLPVAIGAYTTCPDSLMILNDDIIYFGE